jgi:hypothetical protein
MCFSASASFIAAAFTGATGLVAATRVHTREQMPLAVVPLVFAGQQGLEGLLWLSLPKHPEGPISSLLTYAFLAFAKVIWPVLIPVAVLLIEPEARRRRLLTWCSAAGALTGAFFVISLSSQVHTARIEESHIAYSAEPYLPVLICIMYFVATCAAPLLSSHRPVRALGVIVTIGSLVTYVFYWEEFTSVWCFFAAAASCVIVFHFEKARQLRRSLPQPKARFT